MASQLSRQLVRVAVQDIKPKALTGFTQRWWHGAPVSLSSGVSNPSEFEEDAILPRYTPRVGEDVTTKRARLLYQSRKRGMLENGILLSAFANDYLHKFTPKQLDLYDTLINTPSNDWQLYYWIVGREDIPQEYDNEIMDLLKEHARNPHRKKSNTQPSL